MPIELQTYILAAIGVVDVGGATRSQPALDAALKFSARRCHLFLRCYINHVRKKKIAVRIGTVNGQENYQLDSGKIVNNSSRPQPTLDPHALQQIAQSRGLSVAELCRRAQMAPSTFWRWRAQDKDLTVSRYNRLVAVLATAD